ncbi:MAG TPA: hypothetical protein VF316_23020 [Polyangiaceae bacterium]
MRRTFLLPLAATALLSTSALADGSHAIDEADKRFEEGKQLFGQKRYPEALVKFKEACAAHRTPNCPKNLGFTEYRLEHPAEAATQLREFMKLPEYAADPDRELVRKIYDDLLAKVSEVVIHAADGATIEIDHQLVGKAPLAGVVFATTGKHDVVATLKEDRRAKDFVGEAGKTVEVDVAPPVVAPPPGGDVKPPPGGDVKPPPESPSAARWIVPTALGVGAAVFFGLGVGFGASSSGHGSDADAIRAMHPTSFCTQNPSNADCAALADATSSQSSAHGASIAFWIAGGVLAAATVVTIVLWPRSSTTAVLVSPTHASLRVSF